MRGKSSIGSPSSIQSSTRLLRSRRHRPRSFISTRRLAQKERSTAAARLIIVTRSCRFLWSFPRHPPPPPSDSLWFYLSSYRGLDYLCR
ncbi:hypothetical protein PVAP13_8KG395180 [Panicum virgatum]|uniref:Uncharacterized protein n=1 Tax=Panicum virgatum TaxID=38727 RepID=A0A8T0PNZ9_PANVG|nr:hypothetical protein PVAP13_8KG395180 [Panicum virgatum]